MKRVFEAQTRHQRQQRRSNLGSLRSLTVQPATRLRYSKALQAFHRYLQDCLLQLPTQLRLLDSVVSDYIEHLWFSGQPRSLANDSLASIQDAQPSVRGHLPLAWRLLKTWGLREEPCRAPPLPEHLVQALAGYWLFHGDALMALSILLGYYAVFLRTGEVLALKASDFHMTHAYSAVVLTLRSTKTGKRTGHSESVTLRVADVACRVWNWIRTAPPSAHLVSVSPQTWRRKFSQAVEALHLEEHEFRPYSLRRGGATFWFSKGWSLDQLCVYGRWQSQRTARMYLDDSLALLTQLRVPKTKASIWPWWNHFQHSVANPRLEHAASRQSGASGKRRRQ